jgi:hypothetical protein
MKPIKRKINKFISLFNWRFILIHLFAASLLSLSAIEFNGLRYLDMQEVIQKYGQVDWIKHYVIPPDETIGDWLMKLSLWSQFSFLLGLLPACIISFLLSRKINSRWMNTFAVFFLVLFLNKIDFYSSDYIKTMVFSVGSLISRHGGKYYLISNGIFLAVSGLFVFFLSARHNFEVKAIAFEGPMDNVEVQ